MFALHQKKSRGISTSKPLCWVLAAAAAASGVAKVAETVPDTIGESVLQKVRAEVWGSMLPDHKRIPAGAAFAADALGFLAESALQVHTLENWARLSSKAGYVLVKFPGGQSFGDDDEG
jgi:hypothetical protein